MNLVYDPRRVASLVPKPGGVVDGQACRPHHRAVEAI